jgi:hypothetical protein
MLVCPFPKRPASETECLREKRIKMLRNTYWAYGLQISSNIVCPELSAHPQSTGDPDVIFELLPCIENFTMLPPNGYFEVHDGCFSIVIPNVAQYLVAQGKRVSIEPLVNASLDDVRLFLLGSCMGALLYQRGIFPLHGSAVETPFGAMIFVGRQGAGKSTLAAEFNRKGYRLLSDDVCALVNRDGHFDVLPAVAHIRLCPDAYERLGKIEPARFDVDKFLVPLREGYCPHPVSLRAIHVLVDHDESEPAFVPLKGFDRVQHLLENLYRPEYLKGQGTQSELMRMAGIIASHSAMAIVARRRDLNAIGGLVTFLESSWGKIFDKTMRRSKS